MPLWRTELIRHLKLAGHSYDSPWFRRVRAADTPMMTWVELWTEFARAHEDPPDVALIHHVYLYAFWCISAAPRHSDAGHDPLTAAVVCFFEHLPTDPRVRARIPLHLSAEETLRVERFWHYKLNDDEHRQLMKELELGPTGGAKKSRGR
jgi:hypothetical protein